MDDQTEPEYRVGMTSSGSSLSVSFANGNRNPHDRSRSNSGSKPIPHSPDSTGEPSKPVLYPIEPSTRRKTFHLPLGSPSSPMNGGSRPGTPRLGSDNGETDPERQPLISTTATGRRRWTYTFVVLLMIMIIGTVVAFGGIRLGGGEGKGRWPGGPHLI